MTDMILTGILVVVTVANLGVWGWMRWQRKHPPSWFPPEYQTTSGWGGHSFEAHGSVVAENEEAVREWLVGIAARLAEVGIQYVTTSYVSTNGDRVVQWSVAAADATSTRDELALMVGNAINAAGAVPS